MAALPCFLVNNPSSTNSSISAFESLDVFDSNAVIFFWCGTGATELAFSSSTFALFSSSATSSTATAATASDASDATASSVAASSVNVSFSKLQIVSGISPVS